MLEVVVFAFFSLVALPSPCRSSSSSSNGNINAPFSPAEFDWSSIHDNSDASTRQQLLETLQATGMLSITDIPSFASLRPAVLEAAQLCTHSSHDLARTSQFKDGTSRRTFALSAALPSSESGLSALEQLSTTSPDCANFAALAAELRGLVDDVSQDFVRLLSDAIETRVGPEHSLLYQRPQTAGSESLSYRSIQDIIAAGAHLDHFHSYATMAATETGRNKVHEPTIEMHVDQGLFIAVAPALMVEEATGAPTGSAPGRFLAQLSGGQVADVSLNPDALFFMLGDGVNQYVNPALLSTGSKPLTAVPHALIMPEAGSSTEAAEARVWFGRMFLPPDDAVNPETGLTFGKMKSLLNNDEATTRDHDQDLDIAAVLNLGCSDGKAIRRVMAEDNCDPDNQIYCWHRCYDLTDTANPDYCAEQNLGFACTSDAWDGIYEGGHGAFTPRCTNSTTLESDLTPEPLPPAPQTCDFDVKGMRRAEGYTHLMELKEDSTYFMWRLANQPYCKTCVPVVEGALVQLGNVGWLSLGVSNKGGKKKGMNGGHVLMGIVSDGGTTERIAEYEIHPVTSPFDTWNADVPQTVLDSEMLISECATVLSFTASAIGGWDFNTTDGTSNGLIWAAEPFYRGIKTTFRGTDWIGYHAMGQRGYFELDFGNETYHSQTGAEAMEAQDSSAWIAAVAAVGGLFFLLFLIWFCSSKQPTPVATEEELEARKGRSKNSGGGSKQLDPSSPHLMPPASGYHQGDYEAIESPKTTALRSTNLTPPADAEQVVPEKAEPENSAAPAQAGTSTAGAKGEARSITFHTPSKNKQESEDAATDDVGEGV